MEISLGSRELPHFRVKLHETVSFYTKVFYVCVKSLYEIIQNNTK